MQFGRLFSAAAWNITGKLVQFGLSLAALSVIARFVGPQAYGVFSLTWIVIGLLDIVVTSAPIDTLVQRREVSQGHLNASFRASMGAALLGWGGLAICAGLLESWLNGGEQFVELLAVRAASLPLSALGVVPAALLMRQSRFKAIAACESVAGVAASITGLSLAIAGAGVWSLVAMELMRGAVYVGMLIRLSRWRPRWAARRSDFTDLLGFNASTWGSWGLSYIEEQMPRAMIGATLGAHALGCYALADRLLAQLFSVLMVPAYQVVSAGVARSQHDLDSVRRMLSGTLQLSALVCCPLYLGLSALAPTLVPWVFGQAWVEAIVVVQILMLLGIRSSMQMIQLAAIRGLGKPHWHMAVNFLALLLTIACISLALPWGLAGVAAALVVKSVLLAPVHALLVRRLVGLSQFEQFGSLLGSLLGALPMAAGAWMLNSWLASSLGTPIALSIAVLAGIGMYWLFLRLLAPRIAALATHLVRALIRRDLSELRDMLAGASGMSSAEVRPAGA